MAGIEEEMRKRGQLRERMKRLERRRGRERDEREGKEKEKVGRNI